MANTGFLSSAELDFDTLKVNLKTYLQSQKAFEDYNFEGSNMAALLDLLSYNTMMHAQYLNMIGSEMFLDTAQQRESLVSHAKELNYVPRSATSSRITGTITITPDDSPATITIPKNYAIKTTIDNVTYNFVTNEAIVIKNNAGTYETEEITFYEGEVVTEIFTANVAVNSNGSYNSYGYALSSENIDIDSIEVSVQTSNTDITTTAFTKASSLFGVGASSTKFFIEGYEDNRYRIVFGNDIIGKALRDGNVVTVTYRDTVGSEANDAETFTKTSAIQGYSSIAVSTSGTSYGGAERESVEDIRFNAPRHFQTQERAVTADDFKSLVTANFPQIQSVTAYGGEEASPKQYGRVIISVKPYGVNGNVSNVVKNQIIEFLKQKSLTTEPVIVDPEFFYVEINSDVFWNSTLTTASSNQVKSSIISKLEALNLSAFNDFGKNLKYSSIVKTIDEACPCGSIRSNDTDLRLIYRWAPTVNVTQLVEFSYNNQLRTEGVRFSYPTGYEKVFESSAFTYTKDGTDYSAYISDNGTGTLIIYTVDDGSEIVLNNNVGTIDYETGDVQFTTAIKGYTGYINLYARLENKNITVSKNKFLILESGDFNINMVVDNES